MSRAVPLRPPARASAGELTEARLALAEFLLGCDDRSECAQWALDWLAAHTGVRHGLCLVPDARQAQLVAVAGYGLPPARITRLSISLEQRDHPFVAVLADGKPRELSMNGAEGTRAVPLPGRAPALAVPLAAAQPGADDPAGLLVVSPAAPDVAREARWMAEVLGPKLARLGIAQQLAVTRQTLERERDLFNGIVQAFPDPVLLTDAEGRMIMANPRAQALFASRERESEGRRRAIALNNMLFSAALAGRARDDAEPTRRELTIVDPSDGSDLLFELLSTAIGDRRQGRRIVSVLRNVTDLRTVATELEENYQRLRVAEADVRAERDRLQLVIDAVADPILVTDPAGAIVLVNDPAERLFTMTAQAPSEVAVRVQANDAHFSSFVSNLFSAGDTLRYQSNVSLLEPETGAALPFEALAGKVLSAQGELIGLVTLLHDQRQALERERLYEQVKQASQELEGKVLEATAELSRQNELLRRQAIQLEQASALKSQFLANMSHEFRTPLNAILGYTSMLLQGVFGELTPSQKNSMSRVDSSGRHLLALINDILDISRIEAGKMPVHLAQFLVAELIAEVLAEVEPIVTRARLTLTKEVAADLPPLHSDRAKVKQIVINLITNALKFTPEGSVNISAALDPAGDRVVVGVTDTGIGIAHQDQARIFEDFSQADSSPTRAYGGAGLGLAISRRLASMLGGQIRLDSTAGKGSTFTLVLPLTLHGR